MKIRTSLLDGDNPFLVDGISIGERIRSLHKGYLWEKRERGFVDTVVIHYISAVNTKPQEVFNHGEILKIFCEYGVSAHFLISRRGAVHRLVPEDQKAWHCGGSIMPEPDNRKGVNEFSIGIELTATPDSGFTQSQYCAAARLCAYLERKSGKKFFYLGHDQIAGTRAVALGLRKEAKEDPGPLFDWEFFFQLLKKRRKSFL